MTVKEPLPQLALSNSVRAALASWAKSLSLDVGSQGITVNTVLTGYFNTARLRALNEAKAAATGQAFETVEQALIEKIPLRQLGDPTSYGALVTFWRLHRQVISPEQPFLLTAGCCSRIEKSYIRID